MEFKKYNSIENSYRQKEVESIETNFPDEIFVVQEKVHGACFQLVTDGKEVRCAKRTAFLNEGNNFYNWEIVYDRYKDSILKLFEYLSKSKVDLERGTLEEVKELIVYGELYGGTYPHPDVEIKSVKAVQKGVYYCNDVDFIAFDIKINGCLMGVPVYASLCEWFNIPYCRTLFQGTLQECLSYPNNYTSTIPRMHGLPEIENNICEGNVIKTLKPRFHGNGQRVILKNKNEKFAERKQGKKTQKPPKEVPEHIQKLQDEAESYITENRLRNVISKVGEIDQKKGFGMLLGLFCKDVTEDFSKDFPEYTELGATERKDISRLINKKCGDLIRSNFLNIVDGVCL